MRFKEKFVGTTLAIALLAQPTHGNITRAVQPRAAAASQEQTSDTFEAVRTASREAVSTALNDSKKKTEWTIRVKGPLSGDLTATLHKGPQLIENYYFDETKNQLLAVDSGIGIGGVLKDSSGKDVPVKTNFAIVLMPGGDKKLVYTDYGTSDISALDTSDLSLVQIANGYKELWNEKKTDGQPKSVIMQDNKIRVVKMEKIDGKDIADVTMYQSPGSFIRNDSSGKITVQFEFKDNFANPYTGSSP